MDAGRDLDAEVAAKVFGFNVVKYTDGGLYSEHWCRRGLSAEEEMFPLPPFSTDIAAAWKIVEKVGDLYLEWGMITSGGIPSRKYEVCFRDGQAFGRTAPHAICLAALAAADAKGK